MRNIRLVIAYDGTDFNGWQVQPNAPTIQGEIEKRLGIMNSVHTTLHGAGRTDAGVHALGMVAHFQTKKNISCLAYLKGLNSMLPASIRILDVSEAPLSFHSRFSAKSKTYCYSVFNGEIQMPVDRFSSFHIRGELDFTAMEMCLKMLLGTHDFGCFETAGSRDLARTDGKGSTRTITQAQIITPTLNFYDFIISGDGFLRHMVRNIVGTTLEVGLRRRSVDSFRETLLSTKRSMGGATAPSHGLTLQKIYY